MDERRRDTCGGVEVMGKFLKNEEIIATGFVVAVQKCDWQQKQERREWNTGKNLPKDPGTHLDRHATLRPPRHADREPA